MNVLRFALLGMALCTPLSAVALNINELSEKVRELLP